DPAGSEGVCQGPYIVIYGESWLLVLSINRYQARRKNGKPFIINYFHRCYATACLRPVFDVRPVTLGSLCDSEICQLPVQPSSFYLSELPPIGDLNTIRIICAEICNPTNMNVLRPSFPLKLQEY